jgi:charged multivesicular body protein 4A/B
VATTALKRKKLHEAELDRLSGQRLTLETQVSRGRLSIEGVSVLAPTLTFCLVVKVNAIESANINAETMAAMKKGADALKHIHGNMFIVMHVALIFLITDTILQDR